MSIDSKIKEIIKLIEEKHPRTEKNKIITSVNLLVEGKSSTFISHRVRVSPTLVLRARDLLNEEGLIMEKENTAVGKWKTLLEKYDSIPLGNKTVANKIAKEHNKPKKVNGRVISAILLSMGDDDILNYVVANSILRHIEYRNVLLRALDLGWEQDKPYKNPSYGFLDSKGYHAMEHCMQAVQHT